MKLVYFAGDSGSPDNPEWHAWRARGIGGSDAGAIAYAHDLIKEAPSWFPTLDLLWRRKAGLAPGPEVNSAMRRGTEGEVPARVAFEKSTGVLVAPVFGEMDAHPEIRSSFDGMDFDGHTVCEIKCPGQAVHEMAKAGEVVEYYRPQLAHQGLTAWGHPEEWGSEHMILFGSYVPETDDLAVVEVRAMEIARLAEQMLPHELGFWQHVQLKTPPCGNEWVDAATRFKALDRELKALKDQHEIARNAIIELLGKRRRQVGEGVMAVRFPKQGNIDYSKLLAKLKVAKSEAEKYRKRGTETVVVKVVEEGSDQ